MKITTITAEQKARFAEWREKWIKIGLSTEPADFEKAEKAALKAYAFCGLELPKIILRMGSPYGATVGGTLAWLAIRQVSGTNWKLSDVWQKINWRVSQQVGQHVDRRILQQICEQVEPQVERQVEEQVEEQVDRQIWRQVRWQVWHQVDRRVWQEVDRQLWWRIRQQVKEQVQKQVWRQICQQVDQQVQQRVWWQVGRQISLQQTVLSVTKEGFNSDRGGSFWAGWCAYVTFLRDVLGWRDPALARFTVDEDLATSCNWVWWHQDVLAIGDRPSEIHLDAEGRLHNESGPSIAYRDGWKLYHVHGVAVPDFVIEHPDKITVEHVEIEPNAEIRRAMIAKMGLERFIRESGLKPIHSDDFGTLYRKEMWDDEPLVVVKVVNSTPEPDGSRKEYFLRVPPNITRAREAVAWTFGMEEKEYRPATET